MAVRLKKSGGGKVGWERRDDAQTVQELLNEHAKAAEYIKLNVDGNVGKKTIAAIRELQTKCVPSIRPDGRVDASRRSSAGWRS